MNVTVALTVFILVIIALAIVAITVTRRRARKVEFRYRDAVERRYNLLEAIPDGLYIVDDRERITLVNEEAERLLRAQAGDLVGRCLEDVVGPLASDLVPELRRARASGQIVERTACFRSTDMWVELRVQPAARETLVYLRDVTERTHADLRLRESESRLKLLMGQVPAILWTADRHGALSSATGAGLALVDQTMKPTIGRSIASIFENSEATTALARVLAGEAMQFESAHDGRRLRHDVEALRDDVGAIVGAVGVALDITEMRNTQDHLLAVARRDALTGLPNRLGLEETLRETIAASQESGMPAAVFFVDLDRFKTINDTLGHRTGDALLCSVAERLAITLGPGDVIARPGGDEFIIVARSVRDFEDVQAAAARIQRRLGQAFTVDERELFIGASVGAAMYPDHGSTPEELLKHADIAMYRVKASGRGAFALFDSTMRAASIERLGIENDLRQALVRNEFSIVFQPFVSRTRRIVGCETLLRWRSGSHGDVTPTEFIAMAEEMGLIVQITRWVLEEACTFAMLVRRDRPDFRINVNISGRDLYDAQFASFVAETLERSGLEPGALELEVTENVLLDDRAIVSLNKIRALGVNIAVDDFGVSYSVLSSVKRLPITALKIDRSFIDGVATSVLDQAIVKAIVTLAKTLDLRIVAEGVETESQWRFVLDLEVDEVQGYYTGRPLSEAKFHEALGKVIPIERIARRA